MNQLNANSQLFIKWLFFISFIIVFIYILFFYGFIYSIIDNDFTYISIIIFLTFLLFSVRTGIHIRKIESTLNILKTENIKENLDQLQKALEENYRSGNYYSNCIFIYFSYPSKTTNDANDNLEIKITKYTDTGWYIVDLLIKLGLVGTVIGFIIMLSSIVTIEDFDLSLMQSLLQKMSNGMMIALYTTLTGLVSSILLAFQNKMLEAAIYDVFLYSKEIKQKLILK